MKKYIRLVCLSTILSCLTISFSTLSWAEATVEKANDANLSKSDYTSTYKQFLQFDSDSIFAPSPFRLQDELGATTSENKLHLNAMAKFQYDENSYYYAPTGGGELLYANAEYSVLKGKDYDIRASYSFLQGLTNSSSHFDQQSHAGSLTGMYRTDIFKLPTYFFATYSYGYSFFNNPNYSISIKSLSQWARRITLPRDFTWSENLTTQLVRPNIAVVESPNNMTVFQYTFKKEDQTNTGFLITFRYSGWDTKISKLNFDSDTHEAGLVHYFGSADGKYYLYGGFSYGWENTTMRFFKEYQNSRKYSAGLKAELPYRFTANIDYYCQDKWYAGPFNAPMSHENNVVSARLSREFIKDLFVFLEYDYDNDRYKQEDFASVNESIIYSGGVNWRF